VSLVACFILLRETYPPRILHIKTMRLRDQTGNLQLRSRYNQDQSGLKLFSFAISRPTRMLIFCPIVGIVSLFLAIAYGYMYLLFTTFTDVFRKTYGFNVGQAGLAYLGLGIGFLAGKYTLDILQKRYINKRRAKSEEMQPEDRLPPLIAAAFLLAIGLFGTVGRQSINCTGLYLSRERPCAELVSRISSWRFRHIS